MDSPEPGAARAAAPRRVWPYVRAGLVTIAIALGILDGVHPPPAKQVPPAARGVVARYADVRRALLKPFDDPTNALDVYQRWNLFRTASRRRFRLWVEGRPANGAWEILFRAGDGDHDWNGGMLSYRRVRGAYNPRGQNSRGSWRGFTQWVARRVLAARPDLDEVRVRQERLEIQPKGGFRATGSFAFERIRTRTGEKVTP